MKKSGDVQFPGNVASADGLYKYRPEEDDVVGGIDEVEAPFESDLSEEGKLLTSSGECPHGTFVMKHLCSTCQNNADALAFSKERNARGKRFHTNKNSVIFGSPNFSTQGNLCVSSFAKIVTCTVNTGHCVTLGNRCKSEHSVQNGHLYFNDIEC